MLLFSHFQKPARDVDGIAGGGDLLLGRRTEPRQNRRTEMQADPEIQMIPGRGRQIGEPSSHRFTKRLDRGQRSCGVIASRLRQTEHRENTIAHVVDDDAPMRSHLALDEGLHGAEKVARPFRSKRLRNSCRPGEIQEHHRDVLADRLLQKIGLFQKLVEKDRRVKPGQRRPLGCNLGPGVPASCDTASNWVGTFRGRIGFAFDRVLLYATGGGAVANIKASLNALPWASSTELGFSSGVGVEVAMTDNWTAKAEYMAVGFEQPSCGLANCFAAPAVKVKIYENMARGGINYKF